MDKNLQREELNQKEVIRDEMAQEDLKFAALKLIENLYVKGLLEEHIYHNIARQYGRTS